MKQDRSLSIINEHSIIEFNRYHFVVKNLRASGTMQEDLCYYSSYPLICQTVRKVVNIIVTDFSTLFEDDAADRERNWIIDGVEADEQSYTINSVPGGERDGDKDSVEGSEKQSKGGVEGSSEGDSKTGGERGDKLGKLIQRLEYFTIQDDIITVVTSEQKFIREPISSPLLKSLAAHIKRLVSSTSPAEAPSDGNGINLYFYPAATDIGSLSASLTCNRCGRCCSKYEVIATPDEIEQIAVFLRISISELWKQYLGVEPYTWSEHNALIRKSIPICRKRKDIAGNCVFLGEEPGDGKCCVIYEVRPSACRSYLPGTNLCRHVTG